MFRESDAVTWLKNYEGVTRHMYVDSVGVVTVGVGFAIFSVAQAQALPFQIRDTSTAATKEQIEADYNAVLKQGKGRKAAEYRPLTKCDLPMSKIDEILRQKIAGFTAILRWRFADFDKFPDPAQLGLLDMIYNLGDGTLNALFHIGDPGLFQKFPSFCQSAATRQWKQAADECHRKGPGEARNSAVKNLFLKADSTTHTHEQWMQNSAKNLWPKHGPARPQPHG